MPTPALALVTPPGPWDAGRAAEVVAAAVRGGVGLVQMRPRGAGLGAAGLAGAAAALRSATAGSALLFISGDADLALGAGADGVHLPEARASTRRPDLPARLLIGRSVHSGEAAAAAAEAGADLLIAGTVFATRSHPGMAAGGLGVVRAAAARSAAPVLGIGGIGPGNAGAVMDAGAGGVAVISAIWDSPDPEGAARRLASAIGAAGAGP